MIKFSNYKKVLLDSKNFNNVNSNVNLEGFSDCIQYTQTQPSSTWSITHGLHKLIFDLYVEVFIRQNGILQKVYLPAITNDTGDSFDIQFYSEKNTGLVNIFYFGAVDEVMGVALPSPTPTPTFTPTQSLTPTFTPTSTITPTATPTLTVTQTPTQTFAPSSSVTPTITPTLSLTPTFTPTLSLTPTLTPTITYTSSITPTVTSTLTLTPPPTHSITPTVSLTNQETSDPYWNNVVSLLHFDGADGSIVFIDETNTAWSHTGNNPVITTAQSQFGGASGYFSATGYISTVDAPKLQLDGMDFTIEAFIYPTTGVGNYRAITAKRRDLASSGVEYQLGIDKTTNRILYYSRTSSLSATTLVLSNDEIPINTWSHIAITYNFAAQEVSFWINGQASGTASAAVYVGGDPLFVGTSAGYLNSTEGFIGYIDEFRITNGVARYTANFTPPSSPFPNH